MKIGIVVENYEKIPHETEQINAERMKHELEKLGHEGIILYFNNENGEEKNIMAFEKILFKKIDCFYLSGKIKNRDFIKLILYSIIKREKIHFRIPSYNLEMFKKFLFLVKFLIKLNLLRIYAADDIHKKEIEKETGIDAKILEPVVNIKRESGNIASGEKIKKETDVLFIGSYDDLKRGLLELLEAVAILKNKKRNIRLKIISRYGIYTSDREWELKRGKERIDINKFIKNLVEKLKIKKNVVFAGKVENLEDEYKKAEVYVLPIKDYAKMPPIPYTILESLYFKTPVIASNHKGIKNIIGGRFLLKKDFTAEELAGKIDFVLKEKPEVELNKKFLPEEAVKKFLSYLN